MRNLNLFYISLFLIAIALAILLRPKNNEDLSFYGFAESNETEINYNYPVVVDRILVNPGQSVRAGQELLHISRRKSKETLEDQKYRIAELKAEAAIWVQKKENQLAELQLSKKTKLAELADKRIQLENELKFKKSLAEGLTTISTGDISYKPLEEKLLALTSEKLDIEKSYDLKIGAMEKEMDLGDTPLQEQIKRLEAEMSFEAAHKVQEISVTAPMDGLIGNISCKEEEHVQAYNTLLSFYEPHSSIIRGYVHEDLTLQVNIGDKFRASSLKDPLITYEGVVIGLGSRIVEIPTRLRKIADIKSYGREVSVQITEQNKFLQKEKVSLVYIPTN